MPQPARFLQAILSITPDKKTGGKKPVGKRQAVPARLLSGQEHAFHGRFRMDSQHKSELAQTISPPCRKDAAGGVSGVA